MRPVLTAEQSAAQDAASTTPLEVIIDRAGLAVALAAVREGAGYGDRVAILCGPGNNGGDGYMAAVHLKRRGVSVTVHPLAEPKTDLARFTRDAAVAAGVGVRAWADRRAADLVIDAVFGGGFRGELPDLTPWTDIDAPVVAVDVPSGLSATTGRFDEILAPAVRTVTFGGSKVGHLVGDGPDVVGLVDVADIGLPPIEPELWLAEEADAPLPTRSRTAHKWSAGGVMVIGGSGGLDGAAIMSARAALRAGAGAVLIAGLPSVERRVTAPEIMTMAIGRGPHLVAADAPAILARADRFDVLVVGPGLGPDVGPFVSHLLAHWDGPVVLDADGLNALRGSKELSKRSGHTVLTPHAAEFTRLSGEPAEYSSAARFAEASGATVLLKGAPTFVMGTQAWVVNTGGPELASIGTGDVLAGMIGAFWAGGLDAETAARSGAYWHGVAGSDLATTRVVTADALVDQVGVTTRR